MDALATFFPVITWLVEPLQPQVTRNAKARVSGVKHSAKRMGAGTVHCFGVALHAFHQVGTPYFVPCLTHTAREILEIQGTQRSEQLYLKRLRFLNILFRFQAWLIVKLLLILTRAVSPKDR